MDPKWMFIIHYDPRLRHVFDYALVDTEQNNDGQKNMKERNYITLKKLTSMMTLKMVMFMHKKTKIHS